ncbi:hypothetical protein CBM2626_B30101 [Cupriavidus taiwanensis]|nr:hypothetical protein CBM2626_B30101 [Cupriavidus taiwanensis]
MRQRLFLECIGFVDFSPDSPLFADPGAGRCELRWECPHLRYEIDGQFCPVRYGIKSHCERCQSVQERFIVILSSFRQAAINIHQAGAAPSGKRLKLHRDIQVDMRDTLLLFVVFALTVTPFRVHRSSQTNQRSHRTGCQYRSPQLH